MPTPPAPSAQILIADQGFELRVDGRPIGQRRHLDAPAVAALEVLAARYRALTRTPEPAAGLLAVGRELFTWLDGDSAPFTALLDQARRPLVLEIQGPRHPSEADWVLLRAPWELLADRDGHLAFNGLLGFAPVRRLGTPGDPPALDDSRLGLAFMAAAPRGERELDYEGEEAAILNAVGERALDLVVEESGDPEQLATRLIELGGLPVIHLSCHGQNAWRTTPQDPPRAVLLLEDEVGEPRPTDAPALIHALSPVPPRLLFLSACLTATPTGAAGDTTAPGGATPVRAGAPTPGMLPEAPVHSLASALIDGGLPAVLGWDGRVADDCATAFARRLYTHLGRRLDPARAVAEARLGLVRDETGARAADWHLARLWLGPQGGGPVVGGARKRSLLPATHGHRHKTLLGKRVPVAPHHLFVGRRRPLQQALAVLRKGTEAGLLLHGMGRLGKSSLAARIANRTKGDYLLVVLYKQYGARDLLEQLEEALHGHPEALEQIRHGRERLDQAPDPSQALADLLRDLLAGPCAQAPTRLLLIIDDLERLLDTQGQPPFPVQTQAAPLLRAVLTAFDPERSDSRLLLTSRYPFALDGLERRLVHLQLPPFSPTAARKLQTRQAEAATHDQALTDLQDRLALLPRTITSARGNPGLQDLLGRGLLLTPQVPVATTRDLLDRMDAWLAGGDLPDEPEIRAFLESLAVDTLLDQAGAASRDLLRALTLPDAPIPASRVQALAGTLGGDPQTLRGLGLLDPQDDPHDHRVPALAVNPLARGRLKPLNDVERRPIAEQLLPGLYSDWGGAAGAGRRPLACDLTLTRLALAADDPEVTRVCARYAVQALEGSPAIEAATLGQAAIALLERYGRAVPWQLISRTARAAATAGEAAQADALLAQGTAALERARRAGEAVEPMDAAHLLTEQADRLVTTGTLAEAERLFGETAELARAAGNETSVAIARGRIADILASRGELDEALRIRREEELPVYERLGEVRSRAITMGQIADILASRGAPDEAIKIHMKEVLPVLEQLADAQAVLVARANLAILLLRQGREDRRAEAEGLLCQALAAARRLGLPETQQIERILEQAGMDCAQRSLLG